MSIRTITKTASEAPIPIIAYIQFGVICCIGGMVIAGGAAGGAGGVGAGGGVVKVVKLL